MGETKKPSAPTIVDKSLSLAKDKIKKKIQGHESVQVLKEEGGLLSEVQKVVQANVAGGTPYKVLYFCLVAFGLIQFFLGFADSVELASTPVYSVEMKVNEKLDFPTVFVCMEIKGVEEMVKASSDSEFGHFLVDAAGTYECLTYNALANVGRTQTSANVWGPQLQASKDKAKTYCESGYATYAKIIANNPTQSDNAAAGKFMRKKTGVDTYYRGDPFYHVWAKRCFDFAHCIADCVNDPTSQYCQKADFPQKGIAFNGDPTTKNPMPVGDTGETHAERHGPGIDPRTFVIDNVNEKYTWCGDNEAYIFDGLYPLAHSGTCEAIHGGPRYFLEQGTAYPTLNYDTSNPNPTQAEKNARDAVIKDNQYDYDPATVSQADKATVDLMKVFNNEFFCSIVNAGETDTLVMERGLNNKEVMVPFTFERMMTGYHGNVAIVGAYPHGTNPVDENDKIVASYSKINTQNTVVSIGLVKEEVIDQTEIFRWTGRPGPTEGTKTEKWRFNVAAIAYSNSKGSELSSAWDPYANSNSARVENYAGLAAFPQFLTLFSIEDFVVRTVTTSNRSASEFLNSLGGAFALSMAIILLCFKETVVPGGKGTSFKVMTFKFKGKKKSDAEALTHCQDNVKGYTAYELKDGGGAISQA